MEKKGAQLERVPLVFWDRNCVHPKGLSLMPKEINCPKSLLGCEKVGNEIIMQIYSLGVTFSSRHVNKGSCRKFVAIFKKDIIQHFSHKNWAKFCKNKFCKKSRSCHLEKITTFIRDDPSNTFAYPNHH